MEKWGEQVEMVCEMVESGLERVEIKFRHGAAVRGP